mmetsp:Transcript_32496/g.80636  ORF Transcript_32496/g.80636 Transcript_32496/m.80636 type:complete len:94 (-) Transcript_32496:42-323(-)
MCSGCDEDCRDVFIAGWRVRIERICSPPAMQLGASGPPYQELALAATRARAQAAVVAQDKVEDDRFRRSQPAAVDASASWACRRSLGAVGPSC